MIDAKARQAVAGLARVLGRALGRSGISPNMLTAAGVAITAAASWRILEDDLRVAAAILALGGVTDFLDGAVARATGKTTRFGAFLDSVTDRVSDGLVFGALAWWALNFDARATAALAIAALVCAYLVSYLRAKAESLGYDCKVGLLERAERVILLIVGLLFRIVPAALWAIAVLSLVTVLQRMIHVGKQARAQA